MNNSKLVMTDSNILVDKVPSVKSQFLISAEDSTNVGIVSIISTARSMGSLRPGDTVFFGRDFITVNIGGKLMKIMDLQNVKAFRRKSESERSLGGN